MDPVSIIIPAYNEEGAIVSVVERAKHLSLTVEVIVVDDGSNDETALRARGAGALVLRHPANGGYGLSIKSGIRAAQYELVAIVDADETYPIEELPSFLKKMEEGFDMVVGARQGRIYHGSFFKMPARFIFKFLVEFSTGRHIPDVNSGLRVFRKSDVLPFFPILCDTFSFPTTLTLAYCFLHKFIAYIPIAYAKRVGKSKVRIVRDSLRTLQYIVESIAYFNPLKLFLLIALLLGGAGGSLLALSSFSGSGIFLLVGFLFLLGGTFVFSMGVHAEALRHRG